MPVTSSSLQELRDVHVPDPVAWWPPAPGWWILVGLVITGIFVFLWVRVSRRRMKARKLALAALREIKQHYTIHHDDQWVVQQLSAIIRRYALATFSRGEVAGLVGISWLQFLDRTGGTKQFTEGAGYLLSAGPYQSHVSVPAGDLLPLVDHWIQHVSPPPRRTMT